MDAVASPFAESRVMRRDFKVEKLYDEFGQLHAHSEVRRQRARAPRHASYAREALRMGGRARRCSEEDAVFEMRRASMHGAGATASDATQVQKPLRWNRGNQEKPT